MRGFFGSTAALLSMLGLLSTAWAQQQGGPYYGPHMWGEGWWMFFGPLMMIIFIAAIVVVVVLSRPLARRIRPRWRTVPTSRQDASRYPQGALCARRNRQGRIRGTPPRARRMSGNICPAVGPGADRGIDT